MEFTNILRKQGELYLKFIMNMLLILKIHNIILIVLAFNRNHPSYLKTCCYEF